MPSASRSIVSDDIRDAELQEAVRRNALEVLSLQLDVEAVRAKEASVRDTAWSVILFGSVAAAGAGLRYRGRKSSTRKSR